MNNINDTCGNCRYFIEREAKQGPNEALGECYRYPPSVRGDDDDETQLQGRPFVWVSEYCGEFFRKFNS